MNIFTIRSAEESDKAVGMMIHAHQYLKLCRTSGAVVELRRRFDYFLNYYSLLYEQRVIRGWMNVSLF